VTFEECKTAVLGGPSMDGTNTSWYEGADVLHPDKWKHQNDHHYIEVNA
jgi:hypothetical protein